MFTLPMIEDYLVTAAAYVTAAQAYVEAKATVLHALAPEIQRQAQAGRNKAEISDYLVSLSVPPELITLLMEDHLSVGQTHPANAKVSCTGGCQTGRGAAAE